ncbi:MAG: hypothetical protein WAM14_25145, partial [Candidatus Nitrosopolaris sp.]
APAIRYKNSRVIIRSYLQFTIGVREDITSRQVWESCGDCTSSLNLSLTSTKFSFYCMTWHMTRSY